MKKKVLILTTYDTFFLKDLIVKLVNKTKLNIEYDFIFVSDYIKFTNIIVKLLSFGIINSLCLFIKNIINKKNRKCISQIYKKNTIKFEDNKTFKKKKYDLILSINYPHLIPKKYFNQAKYGGINHHLGKIPNYAGRYPVAKAILNRDKDIIITIHSLSKNFDSGRILSETKVNILNCKNNFYKIYKKVFLNSLNPLLRAINNKKKLDFNSKNKIKIKKLDLIKFTRFYILRTLKFLI